MIASTTDFFCDTGFPFLKNPSDIKRIFALQSCKRTCNDSELYPEKITV